MVKTQLSRAFGAGNEEFRGISLRLNKGKESSSGVKPVEVVLSNTGESENIFLFSEQEAVK
ncbi:MAG: hypothetical protein AAF915_00055 [Cyanobacteria bacterium P01_D01_bin.50]